MVDKAMVIQTNIKRSNGIVNVIDTVSIWCVFATCDSAVKGGAKV
jgi:hypothetical protein